ncbi:PPA1309 family protein [Kibdelosporangium lantanae]|uniref:PPA1309 family protein n=1 Tax=Kibdelosporangium lantanae TaxID=1497396 RepID=A0ABW3M210_9PSEU
MSSTEPSTDLPSLAREVEEFVAAAGWDQPPQLFALVPTADLLKAQPELAGQLDPKAALTPIAQDQLPEEDLSEALAGIMWPDAVHGCALVQEIVVLPPAAEEELAADSGSADVPESGSQVVTRLSAASSATEGGSLDVWYDTEKVQIFDPSTGKNLTYSE